MTTFCVKITLLFFFYEIGNLLTGNSEKLFSKIKIYFSGFDSMKISIAERIILIENSAKYVNFTK